MAASTQTTVGQLVVERPSRSRVFEELGIDYCCGGRKSLADACRSRGLDPDTVLQALLGNEPAEPADTADVSSLSLSDLCDLVETRHHAYLKRELPRLQFMVERVASVHGDHSPWMREVATVFSPLHEELAAHMQKEERVLFPLIRAIEAGQTGAAQHCGGTIAHPIRAMEYEHDSAGDALHRIRDLTGSYTPPANACNTFRAVLDGLRELELDMHRHIHKENNVLFPRALELEGRADAPLE